MTGKNLLRLINITSKIVEKFLVIELSPVQIHESFFSSLTSGVSKAKYLVFPRKRILEDQGGL